MTWLLWCYLRAQTNTNTKGFFLLKGFGGNQGGNQGGNPGGQPGGQPGGATRGMGEQVLLSQVTASTLKEMRGWSSGSASFLSLIQVSVLPWKGCWCAVRTVSRGFQQMEINIRILIGMFSERLILKSPKLGFKQGLRARRGHASSVTALTRLSRGRCL